MKRVTKTGISNTKKFTFILHDVFIRDDIKIEEKASESKKQTKKKTKKLDHDQEGRELHILQKRILKVPNMKLVEDQTLAHYPEKTDRHCFNDHYPFFWAPFGIPVGKLFVGKDTYYVCVKYVCSLECAFSAYRRLYNIDKRKYSKTRKLLDEIN